jgi:hypothetical protein
MCLIQDTFNDRKRVLRLADESDAIADTIAFEAYVDAREAALTAALERIAKGAPHPDFIARIATGELDEDLRRLGRV